MGCEQDPRIFFRAMLDRRSAPERALLGRAKRFRERYIADSRLRTLLGERPADMDRISAEFGLPIPASEMTGWWAPTPGSDAATSQPAVAVLNAWYDDIARHRVMMAGATSTGGRNPNFDAWHDRQVRRLYSELGTESGNITHPVAAFELSEGCRVGCWFCAVSADKFAGYWPYDGANRVLWQGVLGAMADLLGPALGTAMLYWATEPLDNPDYLSFLRDFQTTTGWVPQTTTAAPLRDLDLTRTILALSQENPCLINRFSLLTLRDLARVHSEFSADELFAVELVLHTKGALTPKTAAGRALERRGAGRAADQTWSEGTSACVSGFLINLPARTIKLVSPSAPSAANPKGYRLLDEADFADADQFHDRCRLMIARHMPLELPVRQRVSFRPDLIYQPDPSGFQVANGRISHTVRGWDFLPAMGAMLKAGDRMAADIVGTLVKDGADVFMVSGTLQQLYDLGLVEGLGPIAAKADADASACIQQGRN